MNSTAPPCAFIVKFIQNRLQTVHPSLPGPLINAPLREEIVQPSGSSPQCIFIQIECAYNQLPICFITPELLRHFFHAQQDTARPAYLCESLFSRTRALQAAFAASCAGYAAFCTFDSPWHSARVRSQIYCDRNFFLRLY